MYLFDLYVGGNGPNTSTATRSKGPDTTGKGISGTFGRFCSTQAINIVLKKSSLYSYNCLTFFFFVLKP
jgi:hypothetical protein